MFPSIPHDPQPNLPSTNLNRHHSNPLEPLASFAERLEVNYPLTAREHRKLICPAKHSESFDVDNPDIPWTIHRITLDEVKDDCECCICTCSFLRNEPIARLRCGHLYHKGCISLWTAKHATCPMCRHPL
jgi:hypothetical protein